MTLEQIGQKLKTARESQGLTLAEVYERTKIPMHHLNSIDAGMIDDLPESVYVAGFIKRYAEVVGLNGQALSDEYRRDAVETNGKNGNGHGHLLRPTRVGNAQAIVMPAPYMGKTKIESRPPNFLKLFVWPATFIIMLIGMLALLLQFRSNGAGNQSDPSILSLQSATSKFNQVPATMPAVGPPTTTATTTAAPAAQQPAVPAECAISVFASKGVWVDIKNVSNGESVFTGTLHAGEQRDFKDAQGIAIRAGNGGSITVEYAGKKATMGAPGKIAQKTYLAPGAANTTAVPATGVTAAGGTGTATGMKPPVKKIIKKTDSANAVQHKRYRPIEEAPSRQYGGESGGRSVDVPYRYTEGRLDTDNN